MKILSIETSCDDTAICVLDAEMPKNQQKLTLASFRVISDNLASQVKIHVPYGGVYPMLAKKEHIKNLPLLLEKTIRKIKINNIDAIAVTYGPGIPPCLWTGITFAEELSKKYNLPIIPVNHMEGHILSVFGKDKGKFFVPLHEGGQVKIKFPLLALLVSGGHTELVLVKAWGQYEVIGKTLDDAAGEAFDKVARMLGLPYPGGPHISKLAERERLQKKEKLFSLPRPMLYTKNFDFSFSGLKTAVLYLIKKIEPLTPEIKSAIALEFENAVIECLVYKTKKAIEKYGVETLIVAGGVAANKHLRKEIKKIDRPAKGRARIKVLFPTQYLARDNALMIGIAGFMHYLRNPRIASKTKKIKAEGNLKL